MKNKTYFLEDELICEHYLLAMYSKWAKVSEIDGEISLFFFFWLTYWYLKWARTTAMNLKGTISCLPCLSKRILRHRNYFCWRMVIKLFSHLDYGLGQKDWETLNWGVSLLVTPPDKFAYRTFSIHCWPRGAALSQKSKSIGLPLEEI